MQDQDGKHVGLWYFDPYARPGKNSGAWMNEYTPQSRLLNHPVIVSNNANFVKGKVPRDYVEFPSQLLERWLSTRPVLDQFALHFQTGQPVPAELVKKIERTETFNQGFKTVEYLASALVDMKLHLAKEPTADPRQFEKDTLAALGMPREIVMRHRTAQFDAYEAFMEASGPYDKAVAKRLHDDVFSVGNTVDPAEGYRAFRGHDAGTGALMRRRGFAPGDATARTRSKP